MKLFAAFVVLGLFCQSAMATLGVDVSQPTSQDAFSCLVQNGYTFTIVRAYESVGQPDPNAPATVANAWAAGMDHVDVYFFPDFSAGDPAGQVNDCYNFLQQNSVQFGQLWFDIEAANYWGDCNDNVNFLSTLVSTAQGLGLSVGIYTSNYQWKSIMCSSTSFSSLPLWYPHYDDDPSFDDWYDFGGWTSPAIKQWNDSPSLCGASIDYNYYP